MLYVLNKPCCVINCDLFCQHFFLNYYGNQFLRGQSLLLLLLSKSIIRINRPYRMQRQWQQKKKSA